MTMAPGTRQYKSRRRRWLLLGLLAAVVLLAGGLYAARLYQLRGGDARLRTDGVAALTRGEYAVGLQKLSAYLSRHPNDPDVLRRCIDARLRLPEPGGAHIDRALRLLHQLAALDPANVEVPRRILALNLGLGRNTEALQVADEILTRAPADVPALQGKATALLRLHRVEEALAVAAKWTTAAPLDLEGHVFTLRLLAARPARPAEILQRADALVAAHPGDPRFEVVSSMARMLAGDYPAAARVARAGAARVPTDPAVLDLVVAQLDELELFPDALTLLQKASQAKADPALQRRYIARLWQTNRMAEVRAALAGLDPRSPQADPELLAYRAWSLPAAERAAGVTAIVAGLAARPATDRAAAVWAAVLRAAVLEEKAPAERLLQVSRDALAESPNQPLLYMLQAQAYLQSKDGPRALQAWSEAARSAPVWPMPRLTLAGILLAADRPAEALGPVQAAYRLAPEDPDVLAILSGVLEKLTQVSGALDQAVAAATAQPDSRHLALTVARIAGALGQVNTARDYALRVVTAGAATPSERRGAALVLAEIGDYQRAAQVFEELQTLEPGRPPSVILARLYGQLNEPAKAEAVLRQLLVKPDLTLIRLAADLYASQGRSAEAQKVLARVAELQLPPGAKELFLADYYRRYGTAEQVQAQFAAATKAAPQALGAWRQRMAYQVRIGQGPQALATLAEAVTALPSAPALSVLRRHLEDFKPLLDEPLARPLLVALVEGSGSETELADMLQILTQAKANHETLPQTLARIQPIAEHSPRSLPLQVFVAQLNLAAGRLDNATALATQAMERFPSAPEPAQVLTSVLAVAGRWDEVARVGREWRRRSFYQPLGPDLAIAEAEIRRGNSREGLRQLDPYLPAALVEPDRNAAVIVLYAQGLLVSGQVAEAQKHLLPLITASAHWRAVWMNLAVGGVKDPAVAATWLERVAPLIPADTVPEQSALAKAWYDLGRRAATPAYVQTARKIAEQLAARPDVTADTYIFLGVVCENLADLPAAEAAYRQALKLKPDLPAAQNNLAMVLATRKEHLPEALDLINKAVAAQPKVAAFHDTRASVQAALQDFKGALASQGEAIRLEPAGLDWKLHRAALLLDAQQPAQALEQIKEIEALVPPTVPMPPALRQQLDALRKKAAG